MAENKNIQKPITEQDKHGFEEAFMYLLSNAQLYSSVSFYSFIIGEMSIHIDRTTPTAGAGFYNNNFHMHINPDFFNPLPVNQRIGILIHESLHVILKHIFRKGERDHTLYNVAADIALNQSIKRDMLPEGALYPDSFKDEKGNPWPSNETAEFYYELAKKEQEKQQKEKEQYEKNSGQNGENGQNSQNSQNGESNSDSGDGEESNQKGSGWSPSNGNPDLTGSKEITLDSHELWDDISEEEMEHAKQMMSKMIENAIEKSRGNTPGNISYLIDLWRSKPKLSWKKILKRYVSSKKGDRESTIKRRNRRIRIVGVKGNKIAYDKPNVIVGVDTSGSMSDEEIHTGLIEIADICKQTNSSMKVVQIDTTINGMEDFDTKSKKFKRKGCGGTYMGAMAEYLVKNKIDHDVLVMISDLYIEDLTTDKNWASHKKPVIWLSTSGHSIEMPKRHIMYNIKDA